MNPRSNVDYIIVAHMAANRVALSYAVDEWAPTWPLQSLIKSLGGFFVRRESDNPLYRRVLAPCVEMAAAGGVVQAFYPEGQFTRDGYLQKPRFCLINYMLSAFDPKGMGSRVHPGGYQLRSSDGRSHPSRRTRPAGHST